MRLLLLQALLWQAASAAVLSIDYGTEWTKAALVKPGIPLEIVLTKDTKRKEQSVIAFKGDERLYGGDAANLGARLPQHTYPALKTLLGQTFNSTAAREYSLLYPAIKLVQTAQDTIALSHDLGTFSVEELVAMEFINMRKNAETMASGGIRDVVLTVPPFFTHHQRAALLKAAELANLRTLELINDGVAVAMDYAKSRTFENSQIHAIFDVGAGSTSATVVRFSSTSVKDVGRLNKTLTTIEVLGTEATDQVSGNIMSERIFKHLVQQFDASYKDKISSSLGSNPRALARLLKEATRVKQVLSANNEATISVESLHEDIDFRYKLSRSAFEDLTADLASRTSAVVLKALEFAKTSHSDVQSLILHGGAARVPFIQKALLDVVGEHQIARNVNADEAAVMGAVFRGAGLSGSFRVKDLQIRDTSVLNYSYKTAAATISLFEKGTIFGTSRNVTFSNLQNDFSLSIVSERSGDLTITRELLRLGFDDVTDSINTFLKSSGCPTADVNITFVLNQSGMVSAANAVAICEIDERPGVADKLKGWFGGKESASTTKGGNSDAAIEPDSVEQGIPKKVTKHKKLSLAQRYPNRVSESDLKKVSLEKILHFENVDEERIALETARNGLEAYIYRVRDYLLNQEFEKVSSSLERKGLAAAAAAANDWLSDTGDTAILHDLVEKKRTMTEISEKVLFRRDELKTRQSKIDSLQKQLSSARSFIKTQTKKLAEHTAKAADHAERAKRQSEKKEEVEEPIDEEDHDQEIGKETRNASKSIEDDELPAPPYTEVELSSLGDKLDKNEEWLSDKISEQAALSLEEDPVLLTAELDKRTLRITEDFMYMLRKASYAEQSKTKTKSKVKSKTKSKPRKASSKATQSATNSDAVPNEPEVAEPAPASEPIVDQTKDELEDEAAQPLPTVTPKSENEPHDEL